MAGIAEEEHRIPRNMFTREIGKPDAGYLRMEGIEGRLSYPSPAERVGRVAAAKRRSGGGADTITKMSFAPPRRSLHSRRPSPLLASLVGEG